MYELSIDKSTMKKCVHIVLIGVVNARRKRKQLGSSDDIRIDLV